MLLTEAESDLKILKIASNIVNQVFDEDMMTAIKCALEANPSYMRWNKEPIKPLTWEITKPVHIFYEIHFCSQKDRPSMRGLTTYDDVPVIRFFLADLAGRAIYTHKQSMNDWMYDINDVKEDEFDDARFRKCWFNIFVHETAHALDKLYRHSDEYKRHTRKTLQQTKEGKYTDETLELNARIPQLIQSYCEKLFDIQKSYDCSLLACIQDFGIDYLLDQFTHIVGHNIKDLSEDMRKRTLKRIYDAFNRIYKIIEEHGKDIKSIKDLYSYFDNMQEYARKDKKISVYSILGDKAKILTANNQIYYVKLLPELADAAFSAYDFEYKVQTDVEHDDGAILKFKYNKTQSNKRLLFDVEFKNGKKVNNAQMSCKKIEKLN